MVSFWLLIIGYCILIFTYLGVKFWQQQGTEEEGVGECGFEVCWDWHDDKNLKLMECSNTQLTTQLKWPRSKRLLSTEKKCQCYQLWWFLKANHNFSNSTLNNFCPSNASMIVRVCNTEKFQQSVLANAFKEDWIHL